MTYNTFPLGTILFNSLFLLVAIAIESYVFHTRIRRLPDKKTSVAYATCVNLFSNVVGWVIFFAVEPLLPVYVKTQLVSFVFFNQLNSPDANLQSFIILVGFIMFFATFALKFTGLRLLEIALTYPQAEPEKLNTLTINRRSFKTKLQSRNTSVGVLLANAFSYSAILMILVLRSLEVR
jgi:hypothetical protein